jgi:ATP-dependent Clp protease ATP-binding subunit ClpX
MLDVMYELPDLERKGRHVVTADVVRGKVPLFGSELPEKKSA